MRFSMTLTRQLLKGSVRVAVYLVVVLCAPLGIDAYADTTDWLKGFNDPNKSGVNLARQGYFYVNGQYYTDTDGVRMSGQQYVEFQIPKEVKHPYPVVMIHGGSQTAANWMSTLDGGEGWRSFFTANGYIVYLVDQVGRGRSPAYNPVGSYTPADVVTYGMPYVAPAAALVREKEWTIPEQFMLWPNANLHTQWPGVGSPGAGEPGDPVFDQFFASQIQSRLDPPGIDSQRDAQNAAAALLDRIGPAIIITHSQSGAQGFLIADARPDLVKGLVTLEGGGTPKDYTAVGAPDWYVDSGGRGAPWGITRAPITYAPAVTNPAQLTFVQDIAPDPGKLVRCWLQDPAAPGGVRQMPNLQKMPHLLVVGEASDRANHNHCVAKYLTQAGVSNTWVNLADVGIHGNAHMIMVEMNALQSAAYVATWLIQNVEK
jgi:pimeloyl-ACP methyl ester carboxylesterase